MNVKGFLGAILISWAFSAQAAVMTCVDGFQHLVTGTNACQYSDGATQDFLRTDPSTVNAEGFFGFTDWTFISKDDSVKGTSGTWSLMPSDWSAYNQIMLIFKSGQGTTLVGYNVEQGTLNGTWKSPFSAPMFDLKNTRDVSHITFYGRNFDTVTVPEPSLLMLLLLGLGAIALSRLRAR